MKKDVIFVDQSLLDPSSNIIISKDNICVRAHYGPTVNNLYPIPRIALGKGFLTYLSLNSIQFSHSILLFYMISEQAS